MQAIIYAKNKFNCGRFLSTVYGMISSDPPSKDTLLKLCLDKY